MLTGWTWKHKDLDWWCPKNLLLVTDEPVEFEEQGIEIEDLRKFTDLEDIPQIHDKKSKQCPHVTGNWNWERKDLDWLCARISPDSSLQSVEASHD